MQEKYLLYFLHLWETLYQNTDIISHKNWHVHLQVSKYSFFTKEQWELMLFKLPDDGNVI